jgi:hypothetical protein
MLQGLGIPVMASDHVTGVGYTYIDGQTAQLISDVSHQFGKCGPFYALPENKEVSTTSVALEKMQQIRNQVLEMEAKNVSFLQIDLKKDPAIEAAINQVNPVNLRTWVQTLSNFPTRAARSAERNNHVLHLQTELRTMLSQTRLNAEVLTVAHSTTPQNSLLVPFQAANVQTKSLFWALTWILS